jgi:DnaJ-class molecular chaperone
MWWIIIFVVIMIIIKTGEDDIIEEEDICQACHGSGTIYEEDYDLPWPTMCGKCGGIGLTQHYLDKRETV